MSNTADSRPPIELQGVTFRYGKLRVLEDLSLAVPRGVSFGLLGPNGAGKTTLIRVMAGLLAPRRGNVTLLGSPFSRRTAQLIGYMPQQYSLYNELSIIQNVQFFARIYLAGTRGELARHVEEVIRLIGLWERRHDSITSLSGGMKQRVSLACALVHQPPVLFLDEPTVGLDPELRVNFWEHFQNMTQQGVTIVISSHTMDDAAHCDRLAFMRGGQIIAQGTPDELRKATGKPGATLEDAFLYYIRQETTSDA